MVTRVDVAKKAGVSTATVSYVINNKPGVGDATRAKVMAAMQELGYKPSYAARILKTKRTHQLTVFVNYLGDPYEAGLLNHLEQRAREHGYYVSFQTFQPKDEERFLHEVTGRIDGIFVLGNQLREATLEALRKENLPVISVQEPIIKQGITAFVDIDWHDGMKQLINHLTEQGHRRIGFVENGVPNHPHEHRRQAFETAMNNIGLTFHHSDIISGGGRLEIAKSAISDYLTAAKTSTNPAAPTAWIAASDLMAAGVLAACKEAGFDVPGELSITGCENILMSDQTTPALTALQIPRMSIAKKAVDMMVQTINEESVQSCSIPCQLILRGSSGSF